MRVTAVIPCFNHERWIAGAVRSVLEQDIPARIPARIVVVDDGSSDGSHEVVWKMMELVDRCTLLTVPHQGWLGEINKTSIALVRFEQSRGPSFARNRGMEVFWDETEFFAFLDSDDEYERGKLSASLPLFSDPNVAAVYSDYDTVTPDGRRLRQFKEPFSRLRLAGDGECLPNCDSLVRKAAIERCGGFDEDMRVAEDLDLWLRLSERYLIMHLPCSLVKIRVGQHSSSATVPTETWKKCYQLAFEKAKKRAAGC